MIKGDGVTDVDQQLLFICIVSQWCNANNDVNLCIFFLGCCLVGPFFLEQSNQKKAFSSVFWPTLVSLTKLVFHQICPASFFDLVGNLDLWICIQKNNKFVPGKSFYVWVKYKFNETKFFNLINSSVMVKCLNVEKAWNHNISYYSKV